MKKLLLSLVLLSSQATSALTEIEIVACDQKGGTWNNGLCQMSKKSNDPSLPSGTYLNECQECTVSNVGTVQVLSCNACYQNNGSQNAVLVYDNTASLTLDPSKASCDIIQVENPHITDNINGAGDIPVTLWLLQYKC